ncbi:MAG: hypothetical protein MJ077_04255 [Oscillospiraceae bacterium]|nr:hypothetical protein [Oscillospiraceae bacterium]
MIEKLRPTRRCSSSASLQVEKTAFRSLAGRKIAACSKGVILTASHFASGTIYVSRRKIRTELKMKLIPQNECFFNWLNANTNIQVASKVRSTKGLFTHVFGRFAAALFNRYFNS